MGYKRLQAPPNFKLSDPLPEEVTPPMTTHPKYAKTDPRFKNGKLKVGKRPYTRKTNIVKAAAAANGLDVVDVSEPATIRVFMTMAETVRAGMLLNEHCKPIVPENADPDFVPQFYRYDEGWDDAKVAKETGKRLNANHIMRLRRGLEIVLEKPPVKESHKAGQGKFTKQFTAVSNRIAVVDQLLTTRLDTLSTQIEALVKNITFLTDNYQHLSSSTRIDERLDGHDKTIKAAATGIIEHESKLNALRDHTNASLADAFKRIDACQKHITEGFNETNGRVQSNAQETADHIVAIRASVNKLCDALSLNKVLDARTYKLEK